MVHRNLEIQRIDRPKKKFPMEFETGTRHESIDVLIADYASLMKILGLNGKIIRIFR